MGYIQELEHVLKEKLGDLEETRRTEIVQFVKEKVWESYKNGVAAGKAEKSAERKTRTSAREQ